jgi:hypothetical protein
MGSAPTPLFLGLKICFRDAPRTVWSLSDYRIAPKAVNIMTHERKKHRSNSLSELPLASSMSRHRRLPHSRKYVGCAPVHPVQQGRRVQSDEQDPGH